jgi:hypothetical protein
LLQSVVELASFPINDVPEGPLAFRVPNYGISGAGIKTFGLFWWVLLYLRWVGVLGSFAAGCTGKDKTDQSDQTDLSNCDPTMRWIT